jgi:hypothetical protein
MKETKGGGAAAPDRLAVKLADAVRLPDTLVRVARQGMAGRPCTICVHPDHAEIDRQLIAGMAMPGISSNFGVTTKSLTRHRDNHVPTADMQAGAAEVVAAETRHGAGLVKDATMLRDKALSLLRKAEAVSDLRTALMGVREAARCLELMAKLTGDLDEGATINVIANPQFIVVQQAILSALAPHPAARAAVVKALEGIGR